MRMNDQTECSPQSSNALALTLLTHIFRTDHTNSNIVISPLSISTILTILYHGSKQNSRQELAKYLKYEQLDDNKVMNAWKHIFKNTIQTNVLIAHGLFVSQGFLMTDLFRDRITKSYAANIDSVDFGAKETIDTINAYIANKTKGKVRNFLEAVDPKSLLLLVNAVHFKGQWLRPFEQKETKLEVFNNFGTKPVKVPTMKMEKQKYDYYIDNKHNYELLGIPYAEKTLDFFIILPKNGNKESLNKLLNWLTIEKLDKQIKNATEQECDILLPKFNTDSSYKLKSKLKELGLHTIFTSKADFSNINGHKGLHVSELSDYLFICLIIS
ncbi:unnamed protein product, partial [Oppiella nova]